MSDNYCRTCGNAVQPKDHFCQKCGSPVNSKPISEKHTQPTKPKEGEEGLVYGSRRQSSYGAIIFLGIGLLLIAAAVGSNSLFSVPSTKQPATKTATARTATSIPTAPNPTSTPPPPTTPKPTTGRIEGRVYRSDTNQSIANATLILLIKSEESGTFAEKVVTVITTDVDGHYSFSAVESGSYYLWLSLEKIPEYLNYPFCSQSNIPEGWEAYLTGGYPGIPVALIPPSNEFSIAAGVELQNDIDIKVIKCG